MPVFELELSDPRFKFTPERGAWLPGVLVATNLASSNAEAGRLIEQGAIAVNEERVDDRLHDDGGLEQRTGLDVSHGGQPLVAPEVSPAM